MPYSSQAQRGFMHIHHPEIAKRWDKETPKGEKLPEHVDDEEPAHKAYRNVINNLKPKR